ncbi:MAG: hypothetical protein K2L17_11395 [Muribaculaceae bacterium]|nr:hypothetical protein [Muribaculaceae bacterium]
MDPETEGVFIEGISFHEIIQRYDFDQKFHTINR